MFCTQFIFSVTFSGSVTCVCFFTPVTEFGGNVTCSSCDTVYEFFKELVFHVGMVPECCLNGNGTECENTGNSNNERPTAAQGRCMKGLKSSA